MENSPAENLIDAAVRGMVEANVVVEEGHWQPGEAAEWLTKIASGNFSLAVRFNADGAARPVLV